MADQACQACRTRRIRKCARKIMRREARQSTSFYINNARMKASAEYQEVRKYGQWPEMVSVRRSRVPICAL